MIQSVANADVEAPLLRQGSNVFFQLLGERSQQVGHDVQEKNPPPWTLVIDREGHVHEQGGRTHGGG